MQWRRGPSKPVHRMEPGPRPTSEDLSPVSPRHVGLPEQLLTVRELAQHLRVCGSVGARTGAVSGNTLSTLP